MVTGPSWVCLRCNTALVRSWVEVGIPLKEGSSLVVVIAKNDVIFEISASSCDLAGLCWLLLSGVMTVDTLDLEFLHTEGKWFFF